MSPNTELISIIPAHQSTPVEPQIHITATTTQVNPKDNIENNNQLVTNKPPINIDSDIPTRENQLAQQTTKDTNKNAKLDNHTKHHDIPKERENIDEPTEIVHMEEDNYDTATISSISSLNTEDNATLDKLYDKKAKESQRGECGGGVHR